MNERRRLVAVAVLSLATVLAGCSVEGSPARVAGSAPTSKAITAIAPTALIIDASDSMLTADAPGPRIDAARSAATGLVDSIPAGSRLAVLAYGTGTGNAPKERRAGCRDVRVLIPLGSVDKDAARSAIAGVTPRGFTPIAESLKRAAEQLPTATSASIVLISDGEDTCGTPPCDVAKELKRSHPKLSISTVGFKTSGAASDQLRCVAGSTGGMFVGAANRAQLEARLLATQDENAQATVLNGPSFNGIELGEKIDGIRREHGDFPTSSTRDGDLTVYHWHDCDWAFNTDGELVEIRPGSGTTTIDGIGSGSSVADATRFYGVPVSDTDNGDGTRTVVFDAGTADGTGYRATVQGEGAAGRIVAIVACGCAAQPAAHTRLPDSPPQSGSCPTSMTGQTDVKHPQLGTVRVFLVAPGDSAGSGCVISVTETGAVLPTIKVGVYNNSLSFYSPASDTTGNTFVKYNPGRYDGVLILVPTPTGFADPGIDESGYTGKFLFYYAEAKGPGPDGRYVIEQSSNNCTPDCAGGTITKKTLRWNGRDYTE
ncbi:VWA domain-containing protein [Gordonia sp. PDNC005]|uniref:vWA domain-containing protein n=1 Tax=unclassified Gordonia (in: high G+C Gram-positive bacteria) TaxID=2657482 RepID=UPI0019658820|nr:VWA domain-containing protein [Gordonia sp. PDNC005]QRY61014.1 VWA domain-containing protein [Gordonia sp. PDNC005]